MSLTTEYRVYRKASMLLNHRIIDTALAREQFREAGMRLGILREGVFVFKDEEETNILMDFALHDMKLNGKSAVEAYQEKTGGRDDTERELLRAYASSFTSLFKIESVSARDNILVLRDFLNNRGNIKLIDIAFSQCAVRGLLVFLRLIPFKELYVTSGISFVFPPDIKTILLRKYWKRFQGTGFANDPAERFLFFFKENEINGMGVLYE